MSVGEATVPLRPLTVGELLDAGISLLRRHPARLLGLSAALAVAEQLALLPLRFSTDLVPPHYLPNWLGGIPGFWLLLSVGAGTELVAVTLLGAAAASCAVPALLGPAAGGPRRIGVRRWAVLVVLALLLGLAGAVGFGLATLGWPVVIVCTGLIAPVYAVDLVPGGPGRPGDPPGRPIGLWRSVGRGFGLVFGSGLRPGAVRLLNYLAWLLVRLALGTGLLATVRLAVDIRSDLAEAVLAMVGYALADTVAYAAAGCLDAVLHLETRIRLEGLDLAVGIAGRQRRPVTAALLVPPQPRRGTGRRPAPGPRTQPVVHR